MLVCRLRSFAPVRELLRQTFRDFFADEAPVRAAALAYYTVFALPPLLVLLILVAGLVWDPAQVQRSMEAEFASMLGPDAASTVHDMIAGAQRPGESNVIRTILGIAGLLFGATGAFLQLQGALNQAWDVKPDHATGGVRNFLVKRMLSLGMVLGVGFLVAVSLALSALLSMVGERFGSGFPDALLHAANFVLTFAVLAMLFAAIYRVLPDATIAWRDVAVGAVATAALFVAGKFAIGLYLGRSSPGEAFGAAAALAVILIWVYYAAMILLLGAEFTQAWARSRGRAIRPEAGAVSVDESQATLSRGVQGMQENGQDVSGRIRHPGQASAARRLDPVDGEASGGNGLDHASVGDLFRQLSSDTSHLFRQEISLAKAELRESTTQLATGARRLGFAAGLAIPGALAFAAFLIIALGDLMNNYWASALIVSVAFLAAAWILARKGIAAFSSGSLVPEETAGTLREDVAWAKEQPQAFKRAFTAPPTRSH